MAYPLVEHSGFLMSQQRVWRSFQNLPNLHGCSWAQETPNWAWTLGQLWQGVFPKQKEDFFLFTLDPTTWSEISMESLPIVSFIASISSAWWAGKASSNYPAPWALGNLCAGMGGEKFHEAYLLRWGRPPKNQPTNCWTKSKRSQENTLRALTQLGQITTSG